MSSSMNVLVTGGSGRIGQWAVAELLEHGYRVTNVDQKASSRVHTRQVDLQDLGQTIGVMRGHQAVLHLAAIPHPLVHPPEVVFRNNVMSTFNVLQAAWILGIRQVVLAGSEAALGFPFKYHPVEPQYLPIDEAHPLLSQDAYGMSKIVLEELGRGFARRDPELSVISLRFSYVQMPEEYARNLARAWSDPGISTFNYWSYVDVRDAAHACRLALEHATPGFDCFYVGAVDTVMREPTMDLVTRFLPHVPCRAEAVTGRNSLLDCSHARQVLGYEPQFRWEQVVQPEEVLATPPRPSLKQIT